MMRDSQHLLKQIAEAEAARRKVKPIKVELECDICHVFYLLNEDGVCDKCAEKYKLVEKNK